MPISVFRGKGISDGVKTERNQLEKLFLEGKQPDKLGAHVRGGLRVIQEIGGRAQGVGRALHPCGRLGTLLDQLFYSGGFFWSIKNIKNWHVNWTPFGIPFMYNSKTRKKIETGTGL